MNVKRFQKDTVIEATKKRISNSFDTFERLYVSFSGGKDSTVMLHLVMEEALKRNRKVGVLLIDLEAQYKDTIDHSLKIVDMYKDNIDLHWACVQMALRNAVSNFETQWCCWDRDKKEMWVREMPSFAKKDEDYPFYGKRMEFEEFIVLFGQWYSEYGKVLTGGFIGIRADESLHRYRAIESRKDGLCINGYKWTTKIYKNLYNIYPIYDWKTQDIWIFHGKYPQMIHNKIYDKMNMAGVKLSDQRLCQPFGDDQKKGLWLYHILEPETWYKLIARVNGANSGALYIQENGNVTGYNKITKPDNHTWKSFCLLLLSTMPKKVRNHYIIRFKKFISGWNDRGYKEIPDEAPPELESKCWVPSWRRMCKVILRNDFWCKGLGQTQPKSEAYLKYKEIKKNKKKRIQYLKGEQLSLNL